MLPFAGRVARAYRPIGIALRMTTAPHGRLHFTAAQHFSTDLSVKVQRRSCKTVQHCGWIFSSMSVASICGRIPLRRASG